MEPWEEKLAAQKSRMKEKTAKLKERARDRAMSSNNVLLALSFESIFESQLDSVDFKAVSDFEAILTEQRTEYLVPCSIVFS